MTLNFDKFLQLFIHANFSLFSSTYCCVRSPYTNKFMFKNQLYFYLQDVCYLRLDFETFVLLGPDTSGATTGKCSLDSFKVTVSSTSYAVIFNFHWCLGIWGQFHQRFTCSFYVSKLRAQLICAYVLGFYSTGVSLPAQKLHVERW